MTCKSVCNALESLGAETILLELCPLGEAGNGMNPRWKGERRVDYVSWHKRRETAKPKTSGLGIRMTELPRLDGAGRRREVPALKGARILYAHKARVAVQAPLKEETSRKTLIVTVKVFYGSAFFKYEIALATGKVGARRMGYDQIPTEVD